MKAFKSDEGKEAVINYYNMLLSNLTVPYEEISIGAGLGDTFILAAGDKSNPPVILLHGSSMSSAMWINDINQMSADYRVYAPDIPGEPGKSHEDQLPLDTDDYSNWLFEILGGLEINKAILAGASLGAWLAVRFAVNHPERVKKLALLCPAGIGSQNHAFKDIALSLLTRGEEGLNELFTEINGGNPIPEIILNYQKLIAFSFNSRQEVIPTFTDEELKRLNMPCIVFVGGKDIMLQSDETAERVSRLVPTAEIVVLPDRGHSLSGLAGQMMCFMRKNVNGNP